MEYRQTVTLKDGRQCTLRSGTPEDAQAVLENFILTHRETDWLSSLPEEISLTPEKEADYLKTRWESEDEIEIVAEVEGRVAGTAGIDRIGKMRKIRHRAGFGISIAREYWGLGIGGALTDACIACARRAGYAQLELEAVAGNDRALALYRSRGFTEYGRNPRGFRSPASGWQELVLMRLEL